MISLKFDPFLKIDESIANRSRLDRARVLIYVPISNDSNRDLKVRVGDKLFSIMLEAARTWALMR